MEVKFHTPIEKLNSLVTYGQKLHSKFRELKKTHLRSSHWKKVREDFLDENPFCAACGSHKNLQVHHIRPYHLWPELELDPSNLISLCMDTDDCHLHIGHGGNFSCYNPRVKENAESFKRSTSDKERSAILLEAYQKRLK